MILATIFVSGGHHQKDSGAVSKDGKVTEFKYCSEFRDMVADEIAAIRPDIKVIKDKDHETLSQYLTRIKTGSGSVVAEFHLDSSPNVTATGTTALVKDDATANSKAMGTELANVTSSSFRIHNRGLKTESQSNRGKLALVRKEGSSVLLELGFLSNALDLISLTDPKNKKACAKAVALVLIKYEDLIK